MLLSNFALLLFYDVCHMDAVAHPLSSIDPSVILSSPSVDTFIALASIPSFYYHFMDIHSTSYGLITFSEMLVVGILESVGWLPLIGPQATDNLSFPQSRSLSLQQWRAPYREHKSGEWQEWRVAIGISDMLSIDW